MVITLVLTVAASSLGAVGLTARRYMTYLERRQDRQFAKHVFDNSLRTDGLDGYTRFKATQRPVVVLPRRSASQSQTNDANAGP